MTSRQQKTRAAITQMILNKMAIDIPESFFREFEKRASEELNELEDRIGNLCTPSEAYLLGVSEGVAAIFEEAAYRNREEGSHA